MRYTALLALILCASPAFAQGPVLLVGIDLEHGERPSNPSHGPIALWAEVIQKGILDNVRNGKSGILVIGGGKDEDDEMTSFWDQVSEELGQQVSYADGWAILSVSFDSYAMIAVVNATNGKGKLRFLENAWLNLRRNQITTFLCAGGGLFASSNNYDSAYEYLSGIYPISHEEEEYDELKATPLGKQLGFTDYEKLGPWHTVFTSYPSYLEVLETAPSGLAAAIGTPSIGELVPVFSLQKTSYCAGEPIVADTTGTRGEVNHFWSIQESDESWNRYGPEVTKWMGGPATPVDIATLAREEGLPLQCDRYYRVKLAVTGFCTSWSETTQLIYSSCARVDAGPDQCCNDYLVLGNEADDGNVSWEWSPPEDIAEPNRRQAILQLETGFEGVKPYTVTAVNEFGCRASDTVNVYCRPPVVNIVPTRNCCNAMMVAAGSPVQQLRWNDGNTSPIAIVTEPGLKSVDVSTPCGRASAQFEVPEDWFLRGWFPDLIAPNAITADGDGQNDVLVIRHHGLADGAAPAYNATYYELWIFDRFGGQHLVAQSDPKSCGRFRNGEIRWDGRINGNLVQQDQYHWLLVLKNCDGTEIKKHTVIRQRYVCTQTKCFLWWFNCRCVAGYWEEYEEFKERQPVFVVR